MKHNYEQLKKDIIFEQSQLDTVVSKIIQIRGNASEVNIAASAVYLMNFYNGIENIMKRCAREYYRKLPRGNDWHKNLLKQSYITNRNNIPLFNADTADKLFNYLAFRHLFIHGYGFKLDWDKMKPLIDNVEELWREIKIQLKDFLDNLK